MKKLTTLLFFSLILMSVKCQKPDTHTYSDSLFKASIDSVANYKDSIIAERDSFIKILQDVILDNDFITGNDTTSFIADDGVVRVEVNKINHNVWVNIIDGNRRINADYFNGVSSVIIMDSTYTEGSLFIR